MARIKSPSLKSAAVAAYEAALADPGADWQSIAQVMMQALTLGAKDIMPAGAPSWWADYELPKTGTAAGRNLRTMMVTVGFADGESIRANAASVPSKPVNIGRAVRLAISLYRAKPGRSFAAVPAIVSVMADNGRAFDPGACSSVTAELREAIAPPVDPFSSPETWAARAVAVEAILTQRRERLALVEALGAMYVEREGADVDRKKREGEVASDVAACKAAINAAVDELAKARVRAGYMEPTPEPEPESEEDMLGNAWIDAVAYDAPPRISAAGQAFLDAVTADLEAEGTEPEPEPAPELSDRDRLIHELADRTDEECEADPDAWSRVPEPEPMAFVGEAIAEAFGLRDMPNVTVIPAAEAEACHAMPGDKVAAYLARQAARGRQVAKHEPAREAAHG